MLSYSDTLSKSVTEAVLPIPTKLGVVQTFCSVSYSVLDFLVTIFLRLVPFWQSEGIGKGQFYVQGRIAVHKTHGHPVTICFTFYLRLQDIIRKRFIHPCRYRTRRRVQNVEGRKKVVMPLRVYRLTDNLSLQILQAPGGINHPTLRSWFSQAMLLPRALP